MDNFRSTMGNGLCSIRTAARAFRLTFGPVTLAIKAVLSPFHSLAISSYTQASIATAHTWKLASIDLCVYECEQVKPVGDWSIIVDENNNPLGPT